MILHLLPWINKELRVVLGSSSPRRREILERVLVRCPLHHPPSCKSKSSNNNNNSRLTARTTKGLVVSAVERSPFEENLDKSAFASPEGYVCATALEKVKALIEGLEGDRRNFHLLIGADTVVVSEPLRKDRDCTTIDHAEGERDGERDWKILEKPLGSEEAFEMLSSLSSCSSSSSGLIKGHRVLSSVVIVFNRSIMLSEPTLPSDPDDLFGVRRVFVPSLDESFLIFQIVVSTTVSMDPSVPSETLRAYVDSRDPLSVFSLFHPTLQMRSESDLAKKTSRRTDKVDGEKETKLVDTGFKEPRLLLSRVFMAAITT